MSKLSQENARRLRHGHPFHLPPHAQPIGTLATLTLDGVTQQPEIVITDTRRDYRWQVAMEAVNDSTWTAEILLPMKPTILTYHFLVGGQRLLERRQVEGRNRPIYGEWTEHPYKIAVYDPVRQPGDWTQGLLMYQIFPDRFARSDPNRPLTHHGVYGHEALFMPWGATPEAPPLGRDFFGGDLRGIVQRLDYLKDLGVECLYLNPIFEASTNHRYEAINFKKIDPMLGTQEDFDTLIREAHQRGIRVILDAVFNHCSSDSIYFDITGKQGAKDGVPGAAQSQDSPYYRWFRFRDWPTDYDGWLGFGFMPEFVECPEMEAYFIGGKDSVTAYWLEKGIDGWRCDVAFDNTDEFWRRFRECVDAVKPGAYLISEDWSDATHYMLGDTFNATMNYRFAWAVRGYLATDDLKPSELDDRLQMWLRDTPPPAVRSQMNLLDSHDTDRLLTACEGDRARYLQALAFLLAYPGAPCIYYGTETGLEGTYAEDGRRTMPWDALDTALIDQLRHMIRARASSSALRLGEVETVVIDDEQGVYGFARRRNGEVVIALFNASDAPAMVSVPVSAAEGGTYRDLLARHPDAITADHRLRVEIGARGMAWYRLEASSPEGA